MCCNLHQGDRSFRLTNEKKKMFPFDERKEEDACRFSLALKVWITSVAEHTHTHTE